MGGNYNLFTCILVVCLLPKSLSDQLTSQSWILANEMPVDEAALHATIIAINEALDRESYEVGRKQIAKTDNHLTLSDNYFRLIDLYY